MPRKTGQKFFEGVVEAVRENDPTYIQLHLAKNGDINAINDWEKSRSLVPYGWTALRYALSKDADKVVKWLREHGAK